MINNIKNNTISELEIKKKISELNEMKRLIKNQEKFLSFFDNLKTIFNKNNDSNNNESDSNNKNENENENDDEQCYEIKQLND